jgi:hypothetical protein
MNKCKKKKNPRGSSDHALLVSHDGVVDDAGNGAHRWPERRVVLQALHRDSPQLESSGRRILVAKIGVDAVLDPVFSQNWSCLAYQMGQEIRQVRV